MICAPATARTHENLCLSKERYKLPVSRTNERRNEVRRCMHILVEWEGEGIL